MTDKKGILFSCGCIQNTSDITIEKDDVINLKIEHYACPNHREEKE